VHGRPARVLPLVQGTGADPEWLSPHHLHRSSTGMNPAHRTRLSEAFLLLVVLTGWIVAPLVHQVEHALERAEMAHVHDVSDDPTLRTGCDALPSLAEECPVSLTKVQSDAVPTHRWAPLVADRASWQAYELVLASRTSSFSFVRGPPVMI